MRHLNLSYSIEELSRKIHQLLIEREHSAADSALVCCTRDPGFDPTESKNFRSSFRKKKWQITE